MCIVRRFSSIPCLECRKCYKCTNMWPPAHLYLLLVWRPAFLDWAIDYFDDIFIMQMEADILVFCNSIVQYNIG